jgi:hypothetical protein
VEAKLYPTKFSYYILAFLCCDDVDVDLDTGYES